MSKITYYSTWFLHYYNYWKKLSNSNICKIRCKKQFFNLSFALTPFLKLLLQQLNYVLYNPSVSLSSPYFLSLHTLTWLSSLVSLSVGLLNSGGDMQQH